MKTFEEFINEQSTPQEIDKLIVKHQKIAATASTAAKSGGTPIDQHDKHISAANAHSTVSFHAKKKTNFSSDAEKAKNETLIASHDEESKKHMAAAEKVWPKK